MMCTAIGLARSGFRPYREWELLAQQNLARDFPEATLVEANSIFDEYVLDPTKTINRKEERRPGFDEPYFFEVIADTKHGRMYFEFILSEHPDDPKEPDDPQLLIVNMHQPRFR